MTDAQKAELDDVLAAARVEWPEAVEQWGPNTLTVIVRRESAAPLADKTEWCLRGLAKAVTLGPCSYTSSGANRQAAVWSATYWAELTPRPPSPE